MGQQNERMNSDVTNNVDGMAKKATETSSAASHSSEDKQLKLF